MLTDIASFLYHWQIPINFVLYSIIFAGTFYVTIHNRKLPAWHITPLWYLGLASFFICITILLELIFGPEFPLSYTNIGIIGEMLTHVSLASITIIMFIMTVFSDLRGMKNRRKNI